MLSLACFDRSDHNDLDHDILSESTENDNQMRDEIVFEEELELFERSNSSEIILNDPVWRQWHLICRNFDNCSNIICPYSHPKEIYLEWYPEECNKYHRFHNGICPNVHRVSIPVFKPSIIVCGVSITNSAFIRWKKYRQIKQYDDDRDLRG